MRRALLVAVGVGVSLASCRAGDHASPTAPHGNLGLSLGRSQASAGDTVPFSVTFAEADAPGDPVLLHVTFNVTPILADSFVVPGGGQPLKGSVVVPSNVTTGLLTVVALVPKRGDSASVQIPIAPRAHLRSLMASLISPNHPAVFSINPYNRVLDFIAGATDTVVISAKDSSGVVWVGWAMGPPISIRDSVSVSGASAVGRFAVTMPGGTTASPATLDAFARSADGTLSDTAYTIGGVAQYLDRPFRSVALPAAIQDLVVDAKRQVVYLALEGQSAIAVLSLATMTYAPAISLAGPVAGIDLVSSADSLVVALASTDDLAFVDLTSAAHAVGIAHLDAFAPLTLRFPRVARDGRVVLTLDGNGGGAGDYDPTSGLARLYGRGSDGSAPLRSGDGSIVVLRDVIGCGLGEYDATSGSFNTILITCGEQYPGQASASQTGARLNVGVQLLNAGLASLGAAQIADAPLTLGLTDGAAVSVGGSDFYVVAPALCSGSACPPTTAGFYFRFALSTDSTPTMTLTEIVNTPETPLVLVPIPGDQAMLAVGPTRLMLFDLTRSSPAQ